MELYHCRYRHHRNYWLTQVGFHQQGHINGSFRPRGLLTGGQGRFVAGERLANSTFADTSSWIIDDTAWDIGGGLATNLKTAASSTTATRKLRQSFMPLKAGQSYRIYLDITEDMGVSMLTIAVVGVHTNTVTQVYAETPGVGQTSVTRTVGSEDINEVYIGCLATEQPGIVLTSISIVGL